MRKELAVSDPANTEACLFVGYDGTEWYCETFADYLHTQNCDDDRYITHMSKIYNRERMIDQLWELQDRLEK
jgi:hypothetical protein